VKVRRSVSPCLPAGRCRSVGLCIDGVNNYYDMMRHMLRKKIVWSVILTLGVFVSVFAVLYAMRNVPWLSIVQWRTDNEVSRPLGLDVFVSSIPAERMANLQIEDFPSTPESGFLQSYVNYKDHVFVSSDHHILEYTSSGELVRYSDRRVFDCADGYPGDLALAGDMLYVACSNDGIYEIDLNANRILYRFSLEDGIPSVQNLRLTIDGNRLWVATFDGVAKIDRKTREVKMYRKELGIPHRSDNETTEYYNVKIFRFENGIWAVSESSGVARYEEETDSWKEYLPEVFNQYDTSSLYFDAFVYSRSGLAMIHQDGGPDHYVLSLFDDISGKWNRVSDFPYPEYQEKYKEYYSLMPAKTFSMMPDRRYYFMNPWNNEGCYLFSTSGIEKFFSGDAFPRLIAPGSIEYSSGHRLLFSETGKYLMGISDVVFEFSGKWDSSLVVIYDMENKKYFSKVIYDDRPDSLHIPPAIGAIKDPWSSSLIERDGVLSIRENEIEVLSIDLNSVEWRE
jgi:hypothetical protein